MSDGCRAGCRAYTSDLRVRIVASDVTTYPDGAVACGRSQRADDDPIAVVNPVVLVEVTSPSTEAYDRGAKLEQYRLMPSLREVLLVAHREDRLTVVRRGDDGSWSEHEARGDESVSLTSLGVELAVAEVYRDAAED